ncbi:hypothetical protein [Asticcacaulis solisilvae]|uniref:hypothetical protein n=1 Tax=Asticcacaulis solisilvae TaxID=1217274 RepID=UPI003FD71E36
MLSYLYQSVEDVVPLWEGRFKSTIVDAEDYVMACYRYIEANSVRARMVAKAEDYVWSSYTANAFGRADPLLSHHEVYGRLGDTAEICQAEYRPLFTEGLGENVVAIIRDATQRGWVPGSDRFRRQIAEALGRRVEPPVRGRPRKTEEEFTPPDTAPVLLSFCTQFARFLTPIPIFWLFRIQIIIAAQDCRPCRCL